MSPPPWSGCISQRSDRFLELDELEDSWRNGVVFVRMRSQPLEELRYG